MYVKVIFKSLTLEKSFLIIQILYLLELITGVPCVQIER